jgi:hypothetical protein
MQNSTGFRTLPRATQIARLDKAIDICKKFIDANDCSRSSMLVSVHHGIKQYNEVLCMGGDDGIPVPKELLHKFFETFGNNLITERLKLLTDLS